MTCHQYALNDDTLMWSCTYCTK